MLRRWLWERDVLPPPVGWLFLALGVFSVVVALSASGHAPLRSTVERSVFGLTFLLLGGSSLLGSRSRDVARRLSTVALLLAALTIIVAVTNVVYWH